MLIVHLRINDAATNQPTAVRLRISDPNGTTYAPLGRFAEFATGRNEDVGGHLKLGRECWCYIDGSCEVKLPAGVPLRIQAVKGPEFVPLDETATLGVGQMALRFTLRRWSHLAAEGWISGESRCHFISPHAALLEAAAEDVAMVNLLACPQRIPSLDGTAYPSIPQLLAYSGQAAALEARGHLVAVNTLNTHPVLGRLGLLHTHRVVYPISFGGDDDTDDWSLFDWCNQCHRKGGLAVWVDAFRPVGGLLGGEALLAALLGKIDAIEVDDQPRTQPVFPWLYRLWNVGMLVPLVGGSGKDSNRVALGGMRTYAKVQTNPERERTEPYRDWIEAVRAGRTFATSGPLLSLTVGESCVASAMSLTPIERLEVVANGRVIASATAGRELQVQAALPESGWVAARAFGTAGAFAHTSPIRIGPTTAPDPDSAAHLLRLIDETQRWVEEHGRFTHLKWKTQLLDHCGAARARLQGAT